MKEYIPFDWNNVEDRSIWLEPCEESWYYAEKWSREGRKSVLDLGCGLGRHAILFAKYGFKVTAVDISEDALSFLKKYRKEQEVNISCRKADMETLPFANDAFDCIFAMHSAGHADTAGMCRILKEIRRVLKPEGEVFMTLCSKETWSYTEADFPRVDDNTVIKTEGPEQGVPHFFVDQEDIKKFFEDFALKKIRHIDDCYFQGKWRNQKHYFIEATVHKEAGKPDYTNIIGRRVKCKIDRPLGSTHPKVPDLVYPVNYGYIEGIIAGDGAEQDIYLLGVNEPVKEYSGQVIAVYHRLNDNEDKWIVVPENRKISREEILKMIEFQEKFFDGELYMS